MSYFDYVRPTYIENWPPEMARLSFASSFVPLRDEEVEALRHAYEGKASSYNHTALEALAYRLDTVIKRFRDGAFVRLGSRSPKDSYACFEAGYKATSGDQAVRFLTDSERVWEDLFTAQVKDYNPFVVLREYVTIPQAEEFRCFIKNKRIVGLSRYHYNDTFATSVDFPDVLRWAVDHFFQTALQKALHIDNVIADLWVHRRLQASKMGWHVPGETVAAVTCQWEVKLIEINPYYELTDPCYFDWKLEPEWSTDEPYEIRLNGRRL